MNLEQRQPLNKTTELHTVGIGLLTLFLGVTLPFADVLKDYLPLTESIQSACPVPNSENHHMTSTGRQGPPHPRCLHSEEPVFEKQEFGHLVMRSVVLPSVITGASNLPTVPKSPGAQVT